MTTTDFNIHPELQQYLEEQEARRQNMMNPEYQGQVAATRDQDFQAATAPQQVAAYAKAFSQLGTLGGKAADTSSVMENAKSINQGQAVQRQQDMADDQERDKQSGLRLKTLDYLQGSRDKQQNMERQDKAADLADSRTRDLAQMQSDRAYGLANMQDKRAHELAQFNADKAYQLESMKADRAMAGTDNRNDINLAKRFTEFGKDLNEGMASSRSDYGKQQQLVSAADRVSQLGEQAKTQPGGLDKRQIHELAIATAGLVSSGGVAAQSTIESLVPHSMGGDAAGLEEWLLGSPQGAKQQAFVDRMLETADREKFLASEKIKGTKSGVLQMYSDLKDRDPERYNKLVQANFGTTPKFDETGKYVYQQYQGKPHLEGDGGTAMAAGLPKPPMAGPKPGDIEDGHRFKGGNPADPNNWEKQ